MAAQLFPMLGRLHVLVKAESVTDRTRRERFRERHKIGKVEKRKRERRQRVTCIHTTSLWPCLSGKGWTRKERKTKIDEWKVLKENMLSKQRSSVDCSSTVPYPIDCPWGAWISQLFFALGPACNMQHTIQQSTQRRRHKRHKIKHAGRYKRRAALHTTGNMTYTDIHRLGAYPSLTRYNCSKHKTQLEQKEQNTLSAFHLDCNSKLHIKK